MAAEPRSGERDESPPPITVCRRCPETSVFIERDNSDGWIASDLTVSVRE